MDKQCACEKCRTVEGHVYLYGTGVKMEKNLHIKKIVIQYETDSVRKLQRS